MQRWQALYSPLATIGCSYMIQASDKCEECCVYARKAKEHVTCCQQWGARPFEENLNKKQNVSIFLKVHSKQFTVLPLLIYSYQSL